MKIIYDREVDALSITFQETTVTTQHLAEGIAIDYDQNSHLLFQDLCLIYGLIRENRFQD